MVAFDFYFGSLSPACEKQLHSIRLKGLQQTSSFIQKLISHILHVIL
ncbi:hypothetical protein HMPREF0765_1910 [Sphingobacterium spiritivorum ATCC 33300]|uniref:Uncharacterized protein n=1 Tax=Sphingobacterium spiritivorum ATCC 33300 TaxID=525372 RepID=C2FX54_SPHSI|nr:hypothetical protein HMPREF0765_1910 [Sphingobacterium spiritivorum ATCC 33300]